MGNQGLDLLDGRAADRCHTCRLVGGGRRADMWIKAAGRSGNQIGRQRRIVGDARSFVGCLQGRNPLLYDPVLAHQAGIERAEI